jgi:hypothetical protein
MISRRDHMYKDVFKVSSSQASFQNIFPPVIRTTLCNGWNSFSSGTLVPRASERSLWTAEDLILSGNHIHYQFDVFRVVKERSNPSYSVSFKPLRRKNMLP